MTDIIEDVSKLTTIPKKALDKIKDKIIWCICDSIVDNNNHNNLISELDIGIGKLLISNETETIKYKFIPSGELEDYVDKTISKNINPLKLNLEKTLCSHILNTYKDIL